MAPNVKTLSLELYYSSYAENSSEVAFSSITCPSLTSLFIEGRNGSACLWPKECLDAFILRSSFHLTTLSMKSIPLSDTNLIDLLYCVPCFSATIHTFFRLLGCQPHLTSYEIPLNESILPFHPSIRFAFVAVKAREAPTMPVYSGGARVTRPLRRLAGERMLG